MMAQAIAGVVPDTEKETTVMTVWPSLGATAYGRWWGRMFASTRGLKVFGTPILAMLSIPLILPVYFHMLIPRLPFVILGVRNSSCQRYRLTNRRVVVEHGYGGEEYQSVTLDRFDSIDLEVEPGQAWYPCGNLIFRNGDVETFRLVGVPHPKAFQQTCQKARNGFVGVQQARLAGTAV